MATAPESVRAELAIVTAAAATEIRSAASDLGGDATQAALTAIGLVVPEFYDAAGSLAVAWYDELRSESAPTTSYAPTIIGDPTTDWIDREIEAFRRQMADDLEHETQRLLNEAVRLAEKEIARGYRDTILGNTRMDEDAIGWSRITRPGACKFCLMLADKGAVYSEDTAIFAAHTDCHCAARPEFRNGDHGPEASVVQYVASSKRAKDDAAQAVRNARVRKYLNAHYPDAPG